MLIHTLESVSTNIMLLCCRSWFRFPESGISEMNEPLPLHSRSTFFLSFPCSFEMWILTLSGCFFHAQLGSWTSEILICGNCWQTHSGCPLPSSWLARGHSIRELYAMPVFLAQGPLAEQPCTPKGGLSTGLLSCSCRTESPHLSLEHWPQVYLLRS